MLDLCDVEAMQDTQTQPEIPLHSNTEIIGELEEPRPIACAIERIVKVSVEGEPMNRIPLTGHQIHDAFGLGQVFGSTVWNSVPCQQFLKEDTELVEFADLIDRKLGDARPLTPFRLHKALGFEAAEGLSDDNLTHPEPLGETLLPQKLAFSELAAQNSLPQGIGYHFIDGFERSLSRTGR